MSKSYKGIIFSAAVLVLLILLSCYALGVILPGKTKDVENNTDLTTDFTYSGQMKNGKFDGYGQLSFPNGDTYTGQFKSGLPDKAGVMKTASGAEYECEFDEGTMISVK